MSYVEPRDSGRRITGMVAVVAFHIVLGYALVEGLARKIVEVVRSPLDTKIIEEVKPPPPDKPPPPPPKLVTPPPPYIPPPDIQIQSPVTGPTITAVTQVKPVEPVPPPARPAPPPPPPPKPREPVRVGAVVDARACEKPAYPAAALRANETGIVLLSFLIDVDGKVLQGKVERSSGHRRLDDAALSGLSLCKFKPATIDGKAERTWSRIEYQWRLE